MRKLDCAVCILDAFFEEMKIAQRKKDRMELISLPLRCGGKSKANFSDEITFLLASHPKIVIINYEVLFKEKARSEL